MADQTVMAKNYFTKGGDELVIGGALTVEEGATVSGLITQAANQTDSTATTVADLKDDFNALLAKLQAAGLMAPAASGGSDAT